MSVDTIDIDDGAEGSPPVACVRLRPAGRVRMVGCAIELEWFTAQVGQSEAIEVWREIAQWPWTTGSGVLIVK